MKNTHFDIVIIGGGLAGLTCAIHLSKCANILVVEKHEYPNHKVCGEYVSNEILPYLQFLGVDPMNAGAKEITDFEISTQNGQLIRANLPLGGFGMSRFCLDNLLYNKAKEGAQFHFDAVTSVEFHDDKFTVKTQNKHEFTATQVVGAFGKRSNLDTHLEREFIQKKSNWLAIKSHYTYDFPDNKVALHNFKGGYCGLSNTETNVVNACYLTTYRAFKRYRSITAFEQEHMSKNPHLKTFFAKATPVFEKPITISQISFDTKQPVEKHIFMLGDSAGLIHPLCGNGMAMAIHSAKLFSEAYERWFRTKKLRIDLEIHYSREWHSHFAARLASGRRIQFVLQQPTLARIGYATAKLFPFIVPQLIKQTHGKPVL